MAVAGAFASFFILVIVLIYSAIVWRSLDQYFKEEFKKHLVEDKNYQRLQKEKLEFMRAMDSLEETVDRKTFDECTLEGQQEGCNREKMPADKYKNKEDSDEEYVDDGKVCPFVLPLGVNDNNGGQGVP